jgi:putative transposase
MGRLHRPVDDGFTYHAINRGNNRDVVFEDDADFEAFLIALARTQERYPFRLYGYCLMTNHVHLLVRPEPGVSISRVMQSLMVAHTWRYHRRHRTVGHVWQGRFRSPVVQDEGYLFQVLRYIEANPLRARMVEDPGDYRWSSFLAHGQGAPDPLLTPLPEWSDLGPDEASRQAAWRARVVAPPIDAQTQAIRDSLRSGHPYGDPAWSEAVSSTLGRTPSIRPRGRPRKEVRT